MSARGIYGLSGSGLDVESLVKVGMMSRQSQYDKLYKQEVKNGWLKEAYADLYSKANTFTYTTMSNYQLSSTTNPTNAVSSNAGVATATANSSAARMTHNVNVTQMASNAYLLTASGASIARENSGADATSIKLSDLAFAGGTAPAGASGDDVVLSFDISSDGGTTKKTISFTYDEVFTNGQTLNDLASKITNAKDSTGTSLNLKANYDATNDTFAIYNSKSGAKNTIDITLNTEVSDTTASAAMLNNLKLGSVTNGTVSSALTIASGTPISTAGKDLNVTVDGRAYTAAENNLNVSNVSYSFLQTGSSTITVSQDSDKLIESVKKFVEDYNTMIDKLTELYNETTYSDYGVLTKSQRESMTEEQIKNWEKKAKSGLLKRDSYVREMISDMRSALSAPVSSVDSKYKTIMSLGITSQNSTGHLQLDEEKLKKAIAADPDAVYNVISSHSTDDEYSGNGVAVRIHDAFVGRLKTLKDYAGSTSEAADSSALGNVILNYRQKMSDFKLLMDAFEKQLYSKYDAMETAIARLSAQYNYISGN